MSENGYLHELRNVWLTFATVSLFIVVLAVIELLVTWVFQMGPAEFDIIAVVIALIVIFFGGGAVVQYAKTHKSIKKEADDGDDS